MGKVTARMIHCRNDPRLKIPWTPNFDANHRHQHRPIDKRSSQLQCDWSFCQLQLHTVKQPYNEEAWLANSSVQCGQNAEQSRKHIGSVGCSSMISWPHGMCDVHSHRPWQPDIILGLNWLCEHNPKVDWQSGKVKMSHCLNHCHTCQNEVNTEWKILFMEAASIRMCWVGLLPLQTLTWISQTL